MPYISVYIHFVWSTKNGYPLLNTPELRKKVWLHISENAETKGIYVDFINGYSNHCHCLVSLASDMTISKTMQLIKGESSFWINKTNFASGDLSGRKSIMLFPFPNQLLTGLEIISEIRKNIIRRKHLKRKKTSLLQDLALQNCLILRLIMLRLKLMIIRLKLKILRLKSMILRLK